MKSGYPGQILIVLVRKSDRLGSLVRFRTFESAAVSDKSNGLKMGGHSISDNGQNVVKPDTAIPVLFVSVEAGPGSLSNHFTAESGQPI
jgi:hypothetical protein